VPADASVRFVWMIAAGWLALVQLQGQSVSIHPRGRQADIEQAPAFRADTSLVQVPVTVTDRLNRPVVGLDKENFRVFDDKVEQTVVRFASDDEPVAIGFVFDVSGSIGASLGRYRLAAREFFRVAEEDDQFFLVTFADAPKLAVPLTRRAADIEYQIMMSRSRGWTALFDAVRLAASEIRKSNATKKALILISDGEENHSRYTFAELRDVLLETDALLYSIGPSGSLLMQLSEMTGGRLLEMERGNMIELSRQIIIDLRNRYVLYYSPQDKTRDGRYHHIGIQVVPPRGLGKLKAHWRTGYYAPD
jgi:Ca-activated chloride channel homolog